MTKDRANNRDVRAYMAEHGVNFTTAKRALATGGATPGAAGAAGPDQDAKSASTWVAIDVLAMLGSLVSDPRSRAAYDAACDQVAELQELPAIGEPGYPQVAVFTDGEKSASVAVRAPVATEYRDRSADGWWLREHSQAPSWDGTDFGALDWDTPAARFLREVRAPVTARAYSIGDDPWDRLWWAGEPLTETWAPFDQTMLSAQQRRVIRNWKPTSGSPDMMLTQVGSYPTSPAAMLFAGSDFAEVYPSSIRAQEWVSGYILDEVIGHDSDEAPSFPVFYDAMRRYLVGVGLGVMALDRGTGDGSLLGTPVRLPWDHMSNRAFLRCMYGAARCLAMAEQHKAALLVFRELLALCPDDNIGARYDINILTALHEASRI